MYRSAWKTFEDWTSARAVLGLPASPALVAAYLSHLAEERHLSVATVRLHRAAAASDRVVHHSVVLQTDLPSYRTAAIQQRGQAEEMNWQE